MNAEVLVSFAKPGTEGTLKISAGRTILDIGLSMNSIFGSPIAEQSCVEDLHKANLNYCTNILQRNSCASCVVSLWYDKQRVTQIRSPTITKSAL